MLLSESKTGHDTEIYWSMSQQTHYDVTDKNSYVDFVRLNIHYHLYRILQIIVYRDFQNCHNSIFKTYNHNSVVL